MLRRWWDSLGGVEPHSDYGIFKRRITLIIIATEVWLVICVGALLWVVLGGPGTWR